MILFEKGENLVSLETYQGQDVIVRNYVDGADVKDYINTVLVAKYFPRVPMNDLKVGEMGLISEYMANIVDDGSYGTAVALNEAFITRSILDESIYSAAATFDLGYEMAVPASVPVTLEISYDDILNYAVNKQVYIDKDTKFLINGHVFVLDYDVRLTYTYIGGLIRFSAAYDMSEYNPVATATTPYIICRVEGQFVTLEVTVREYTRTYQTEQITNNLVFTASPIDLPFSDMICGLKASYLYNGEKQLMTNKPKYAIALSTPFLYHRMKDENTIQVSFASGKNKWRPEFNSQIEFTLYTTHGDDANFQMSSKDMECSVVRTGDRFIYNADLRMVAYPHGDSQGGLDQPNIEMVRQDTILAFNTAHVLMTDDDISLFFETYAKRYGTVAKFFKRRDDPTGRLFGMFNIINKDNYIYETLTARGLLKVNNNGTNMIEPGVNGSYTDQFKEITLYSGDLWKYYDFTEDELDQHTTLTLMGGNMGTPHSIPEEDVENVFVNPFIMKINRYPGLVSYYNPLINYNGVMKQEKFEENVLDHFQVTYIEMYRGIGENRYKVRVMVVPTTQEDTYNEYDPDRRFKYNYFSNPDDTYYVSFSKANLNDDPNTNNGEDIMNPDGTLNPNYKRSLVEYMKDTYGIFPSDGNTVYNTDVTETESDGFFGKYVYNSVKGYIRITPDLFPLRLVLSAETSVETCYTEMVCVNEENGVYTFETELKTENDVGLVQGQEVLTILLGDSPYGTKAIQGKTPTAAEGTTYVMSSNTKLHVYTIYKPVNSDAITIDPAKDKKMFFDASNGTPPITNKVKLIPEIFDMRLNAIVHQIQTMNPMKQQGIIDDNFYVENMDDHQKYRFRGEDMNPQWQITTGAPTSEAYLFQFKFSAPPSIYNADPVLFSKNISAAFACIPFADGTYKAEIEDESTVISGETGSTYQYVKSSDRWLLLGSPSLFNEPSFRGWNVTDVFLNDYAQFDLLEHWTQMRSTVIFNGNLKDGYRVDVGLVPYLRYDLCQDPEKVAFVIKAMVAQYKSMTENIQDRLEENVGVDFKLYNTCGRGVFYKIGVNSPEHPNWTRMDKISIRIKFILGVREEVLYQDTEDAVKDHIKSYIENLDITQAEIFNVSNLQTSIENSIPNVKYLIFLGINDYDPTYQRIKLDDPYKIDMTMYEYQIYVPEFLTINRDNILITHGTE